MNTAKIHMTVEFLNTTVNTILMTNSKNQKYMTKSCIKCLNSYQDIVFLFECSHCHCDRESHCSGMQQIILKLRKNQVDFEINLTNQPTKTTVGLESI